MWNECDRRADPAATQALTQRPELVGAICAAQQDQVPKVDPRSRQSRQVKLALGIVPCNRAAAFLRRLGKQQRDRRWTNPLTRPEQFVPRAALESAMRCCVVKRLQAG